MTGAVVLPGWAVVRWHSLSCLCAACLAADAAACCTLRGQPLHPVMGR